RRLPAALVPSRFVRLARLPAGANGKIDRAALPPPVAPTRKPSRPPADAVERELAGVFAEVLGLDAVGAEDGFFDLGGHSLLAVPLLAAVEERFGRRLPLAVLFERDTVAALAELLRRPVPLGQEAHPVGDRDGGTFPRQRPRSAPRGAAGTAAAPGALPRSPLVALRATGSRSPLHLVHPGGGGVLCYADLARALGADQPLLALQSVGLDGEAEPLGSIDAMAERYLAAMAEARAAGDAAGGPWHLGGWSFGGRVAFEMARRLRAAGEPVGLVALLDIAPDSSPAGSGAEDDDPALIERVLGERGGAFAGLAAELREVVAGGGDEGEQIAAIAARLAAAGGPPIDSRRAAAALRVFRTNMAAARRFRQRPYSGPVTLLRAAASDRFAGFPGDPTGGWGLLAARVEVVTVPGDHRTMVLPPNAVPLAAALRAALDAAGRRALLAR
ncbi:MAG TPA: thioesterase domain-containing protein, partial [Thermoanaerobaculia bacterium]|nr:thioesterase domain-containing protein [Thermoanaerobaculia bacterium]